MSEVLPQNHLTLACLYASAKDQPYWIRQRYAHIMQMLLDLDIEMRKKKEVDE